VTPSGGASRAVPAGLRIAALLWLGAAWILLRDDRVPEGRLDLPERLAVSIEEVEAAGWTSMLLQAAEGPLVARVSGRPPPLRVDPPPRLRAGRASTLGMRAGEAVQVRLESSVEAPRTLSLEAGEEGEFLLRPRSPGWTTWRIEARPARAGLSREEAPPDGPARAESVPDRPAPDGLTYEWSGWVEPPRPLRILALTGPPGSESRFAVRALEESGEEVEVWTHLGRGLWIGRAAGEALPTEAADYAGVDVILLFPGLALTPPEAGAILDAVRVGGTGLLLAATDGGSPDLLGVALGVVPGVAPEPIRADAIDWSVPAEIRPLPPLDLSVRIRAPAAGAPGPPAPLLLSAQGRGRVGALSLPDTWSWRMEGGAEEAHRAFWRSVADWLSDGFARDPALEILAEEVRVGEPVRFRWLGSTPLSQPPAVRLEGPDRSDVLRLASLRETGLGSESMGTFVPIVPGGYHLEPMDPGSGVREGDGVEEDVLAGDMLAGDAPEGDAGQPTLLEGGAGRWALDPEAGSPDPEGRLARLATASHGGGIEWAAASPSPTGGPTGGPFSSRVPWTRIPWPLLLFGVSALLLLSEWTLRRLDGRP
jgi:hypothetical protein